jgi:tryptophan synthase alpha chain
MTPRDRISAAIRSASKSGDPALVAFLTAGFPTKSGFKDLLRAIAAGADVVEIGVPFTDPMADGVTIQRSSTVALQQGVSLSWILDELASMPKLDTPLLLMSYLNPLLSYGLDKLAAKAEQVGVCGFIVPDLPVDESDDMRAALDAAGVALVQMATPVTDPARLQRICDSSQGFVYAVTMTGTTGKNVAVPEDVLAYLDRVRAASKQPVCAGFGIRSREQVERLSGHVDGVVVGSALIEVIERGDDVTAFLRGLRRAAR